MESCWSWVAQGTSRPFCLGREQSQVAGQRSLTSRDKILWSVHWKLTQRDSVCGAPPHSPGLWFKLLRDIWEFHFAFPFGAERGPGGTRAGFA